MWLTVVYILLITENVFCEQLSDLTFEGFSNELDHGTRIDYKQKEDPKLKTVTFPRNEGDEVAELSTGEGLVKAEVSSNKSSTLEQPLENAAMDNVNQHKLDDSRPKIGSISKFLMPFGQKITLSSQASLRDRLSQFKESINNFGANTKQSTTGKQFTSGLLQLMGIIDPGFYVNRLEPAGFFGGNGWFANKGGILGGPGVIVSSGSLLTDYPTAYKK